MRTIGSQDGDIQFAIVDGIDSVSQRLTQRLRFIRGEWFLRKRRGIPYLTDLLGLPENRPLVHQIIARESLDVADVLEVVSIDINFDSAIRDQTIKVRVRSVFGEVEVTTAVLEDVHTIPSVPLYDPGFWTLNAGDDFWSLGTDDDFWSMET